MYIIQSYNYDVVIKLGRKITGENTDEIRKMNNTSEMILNHSDTGKRRNSKPFSWHFYSLVLHALTTGHIFQACQDV